MTPESLIEIQRHALKIINATVRMDCELTKKDLKWHDASLEKPDNGETVLCIKEIHDVVTGECKKRYDFGTYHSGCPKNSGWFGNNPVRYWMGLPDMPEE